MDISRSNRNELFYDENDKLVREMKLTDVKMMGGRLLPTTMTIVPYDKPGEFTEVTYVEISFDMELSDTFFSLLPSSTLVRERMY